MEETKEKFAIRSSLTSAYVEQSSMGLGFFQIVINDECFGLDAVDATLLACSFDEVEKRIAERGKHAAGPISFASKEMIARSVVLSLYSSACDGSGDFFGFEKNDYAGFLYGNSLIWAPDGDQAFDDGSVVLQFDVADDVRVIGFRHDGVEVRDVQEVWLNGDRFYGLLADWRDSFLQEWRERTTGGVIDRVSRPKERS